MTGGIRRPSTARRGWARRLKRVFGIDIETCARCGGKLAIIASIEEPQVIARIQAHLQHQAPEQYQSELPLKVAGAAAAIQPEQRDGETFTSSGRPDALRAVFEDGLLRVKPRVEKATELTFAQA